MGNQGLNLHARQVPFPLCYFFKKFFCCSVLGELLFSNLFLLLLYFGLHLGVLGACNTGLTYGSVLRDIS